MRYSNIDALHETSARPFFIARERPAEAEPVLLADVALGDREEAREAALACEQVVVARVEPALVQVVADREELAMRVEEDREVGVLPHLARDLGSEAQPREQFDCGADGRCGSSRRASPPSSSPPRRPLAMTSSARECLREALGESHQARDASEQRLERGVLARAGRGVRDELRPRHVLVEQRLGLANRGDHVRDGELQPLTRRRRNARLTATVARRGRASDSRLELVGKGGQALELDAPFAEIGGALGDVERVRERVERLTQSLRVDLGRE